MNVSLVLKKQLYIFFYSSRLILKLIAIDQITKWWFIGYLEHRTNYSLEVTSFFELIYTWNHGISFGLFKGYTYYSNILFIILNSLITGYLWYQIYKFKSSASFIGYSFIVGGAVGNIIDRLVRGAVFDFIYFHYDDYGFPVFNVADAFISIGGALLIHDYYKEKKSIEQNEQTNYDASKEEAEKIREISNRNLESK